MYINKWSKIWYQIHLQKLVFQFLPNFLYQVYRKNGKNQIQLIICKFIPRLSLYVYILDEFCG